MSVKTIDLDVKHQALRHDAHRATDTPPTWTHTLVFRALATLGLMACLILQCICAVIISQYSPSHSMKGEERFKKFIALCESAYLNSSLRIIHIPIPKSTDTLSVPNFMIDPSAAIFINAVMIHASAALVSYNMGGDRRHQDRFLAMGAILGILVGVSLASSGSSLEAFKDSIPISITTALMLGQLWHIMRS